MKNAQLIIGFFLVFALNAYSQDSSKVVLILKTMPTTMFDLDNTFTFGAEIPFMKVFSFQQEIGWGNANANVWQNERETYPDKVNWRFRTQFRHYFYEDKTGASRFYWGAEYFRKDVFINQPRSVGRQCNAQTGVCAYFETVNVRTHRAINGLHLKIGYQAKIGSHLILDFFTGLGIREVNVSNDVDSQNTNTFFGRRPLFIFRSTVPGSETRASIALGFSVGYEIRKKGKF